MALATETGEATGLRTNHLGFPEVVAQSIGVIAPSGTPGLVIPVVFATAGNGTWLAYLFATLALLVVGLQVNVFASRIATPGALYVYAGHGLGRLAGVVAGWSLLIGYVFTAAAVINGTISTTLALVHALGFTGDGLLAISVTGIVAVLLAFWFAWRDIRLSTRTTLLIEFATIALIVLTVVLWFLKKGPLVDPDQIHLTGVNPEQLRLGLVLAFFSFVGFESAAVLGVEAQKPRQFIPRAILTSVIAVGVLFIISAYGLVAGFHGVDPTLDKSDAPLTVLTVAFGAGWVGLLISAGVALSFFTCILASINAAARVLFTLSHNGLFHGSARGTHTVHASPHIAVAIITAIAFAASFGLLWSGWSVLDAYGILGSLATYGILISYVLVTIGAPLFLKRRGELQWYHVLSAVVALVLVGIVLVGTVYPLPAWPYNVLPYIYLALLAVGVVYFFYLKSTRPESLAEIEAELLGATPAE